MELVMGAPGCDDATIVNVSLGSVPRDVTFVYPYYENPKFLATQIETWCSYPKSLRDHIRVIVVDDGSPKNPASSVIRQRYPFSLSLFRIEVDVRWNWIAARNIGMHRGPQTGWRVMTDMDHVIPAGTLRTLVYGLHDDEVIYRFSRIGAKEHPHPNSWFMTRAMFWKIGGYDEACSGFYGTDGDYRRRCAAAAQILIMQDPLVCHEHEGDSSTMRYKRKQPEDSRAKQIVRDRPKRGWRPRTLTFPYHEVTL